MPEKNRFPAVLQPVTVVHGTQNPITSEDCALPLARISGQENAIAYAIQERAVCENPNAGPDGAGVRADDCAYTLEARSVPQGVAYSVALRGREGGGTAELGDEIAGCLRASGGGGDKPHVLTVLPFDTTQVTSQANRSNPAWGDPCHPIAAGAHPPAVCVTGSVTHTLKAEGFDASEDGTGRGQPITVAFQGRGSNIDLGQDVTGTLSQNCDRASGGAPCIADTVTMAVRRLMPVECERLQGFPDNWTLVPTGKHGKPAADGPRYKQCGNSMATHVMHWIGRRIADHLRRLDDFDMIGHNGGPALDDFEALA